MIITWRLGPYEVRSLPHNNHPTLRRHHIFRDGTELGAQFCVPTFSDAKAHEEAHAMAKKQSAGA